MADRSRGCRIVVPTSCSGADDARDGRVAVDSATLGCVEGREMGDAEMGVVVRWMERSGEGANL